jgi:hypothetical protein
MENNTVGTQKNKLLVLGLRLWLPIKNRFFNEETDRKQKIMTTLIPLLFVILSFVLFKVFHTASPKAVMAQASGPMDTVTSPYEKTDWHVPAPYPESLRDPMQYGSVTAAQSDIEELAVRGIVFSEDKPSAVINGKIVRQGDIVSGTTIIKINRNSVEFEIEGKRWTRQVQ